MKKLFITVLAVFLFDSVYSSKVEPLSSIDIPTFYASASIIGIDGCCYTVRVDLHMVTDQYDMIITSATKSLGEVGCCPTGSNVFVDLPGYDESIYTYYGVEPEITQAIDEAIDDALLGYVNVSDFNRKIRNPFRLNVSKKELNGKVANISVVSGSTERFVLKVYNENGTFLRRYSLIELARNDFEINLNSEVGNLFYLSIDCTNGNSYSAELKFI